MKSIRNLLAGSLLAAGALLTAAAGISMATAADEATSETPPPPPGPHGWHHGRGHGHGQWHLLHKLGLSAAQQQSVKAIMAAAGPQMKSLHEQMRSNSQKLDQTKPTDPNYTSIVAQVSQTQGSLSAQMMTQQADVRAQVFKVLTPGQQEQLATLEAKMQARRAAWAAHRGGPNGATPAAATTPAQ